MAASTTMNANSASATPASANVAAPTTSHAIAPTLPIHIEPNFSTMQKWELERYCRLNGIPREACRTNGLFIERIKKAASQPVMYYGLDWNVLRLEAELNRRGIAKLLGPQPAPTAPITSNGRRRPTSRAANSGAGTQMTPKITRKAQLISILEADDKAREEARTSYKGGKSLPDMPPEIRNRICRYALVPDAPAALVRPRVPALCQVPDKQFREECLSIWYGFNTFLFRVDGSEKELRPQGRVKVVREAAVGEDDTKWVNTVVGKNAPLLRSILVGVAPNLESRTLACTRVEVVPSTRTVEIEEQGVWFMNGECSEYEPEKKVVVPPDLEEVMQRFAKEEKRMPRREMWNGILQCFTRAS